MKLYHLRYDGSDMPYFGPCGLTLRTVLRFKHPKLVKKWAIPLMIELSHFLSRTEAMAAIRQIYRERPTFPRGKLEIHEVFYDLEGPAVEIKELPDRFSCASCVYRSVNTEGRPECAYEKRTKMSKYLHVRNWNRVCPLFWR